MVLALDALWFAFLVLILVIFCSAYLMSVRVFWALILLVIVVGLGLTAVSMISKRKREKTQLVIDETMLLDYLKSHGIGGNVAELAQSLGLTEAKALKLLLSLEEQGTIPVGSVKAFAANKPDDTTI